MTRWWGCIRSGIFTDSSLIHSCALPHVQRVDCANYWWCKRSLFMLIVSVLPRQGGSWIAMIQKSCLFQIETITNGVVAFKATVKRIDVEKSKLRIVAVKHIRKWIKVAKLSGKLSFSGEQIIASKKSIGLLYLHVLGVYIDAVLFRDT